MAACRSWSTLQTEGVLSFEEAVELYRGVLLRRAESLVGASAAEDVVQETLVRCWRSGIQPDDWRAWLMQAVYNTSLHWLRLKRNEQTRAGGEMESYDRITEEIDYSE